MIENRQFHIKRREFPDARSLPEVIADACGPNVLRWYIARANAHEVVVEATLFDEKPARPDEPGDRPRYPGKHVVLSVVPTGVGCDIGGYAGDASPVTNLLAQATDYLITNPNAVNASDFVGLSRGDNIVYTDGCSMDLFCKGLADLHLPYSNKIGLIIDHCEPSQLDVVLNVLNTVRAVHGVEVTEYVVTGQTIGGRFEENESGGMVGTLDHPEVLFDACDKLLDRGVNAIAITSNIKDLPYEDYARHFEGAFPNPIGGVEAIISYLVTSRYRLPAAHAPLINTRQLDLAHNVVDARGAGEMSSASGLACILVGLRRAPQLHAGPGRGVRDIVNVNNLAALVTPAGCLGGVPSVYAHKYGIPIIAVQENRTIFDVTKASLGLNDVIEVRNYAEAAGVVLALKAGISLESISRPLQTFRFHEETHDTSQEDAADEVAVTG
jgi:hypothetical protein